MALTVQNDAGTEANADSYQTLDGAKTYWTSRGMNVEDYDDTEQLEPAMRVAFDYINSKWRYKGERLTDGQDSEFPRAGLLDWSSKPVTGIPKRVKEAQCDLAFACKDDLALFQNLDRGGAIKSESVGPVSVTYMDGAAPDVVYQAAAAKLRQYIRNENDLRGGPSFGTDITKPAPDTSDALFTIGQMDNPQAGTDDPTQAS